MFLLRFSLHRVASYSRLRQGFGELVEGFVPTGFGQITHLARWDAGVPQRELRFARLFYERQRHQQC